MLYLFTLLLVGAVMAALVHELGHALGGLLAGERVSLLIFGAGPLAFRLRRTPPRLEVRPLLPLGGLCLCDSNALFISPSSRFLKVTLGPGANLLATLPLLLLGWFGHSWAQVLAVSQLLFALAQLLPVRLGSGHSARSSDGSQLLSILAGRDHITDPKAMLASARSLRQLGVEELAQRDFANGALLAAEQDALPQAREMLREMGPPLDRTRQVLALLAERGLARAQQQTRRSQELLNRAIALARGLPGEQQLLRIKR